MKNFVWLKLILLLIVAPGILKAAEVPFHLVHNLIIVQAEIDHKRGNFILDTGADMLILHEKKVISSQISVLHTLDGIHAGSQKSIQRFAFGNNTFKNLTAITTDLTTVSHFVDFPIDGIIGAGMLKNSSVLIDFEQKEIKFLSISNKPKHPNLNQEIPFKMVDGVPVTKVKIGRKYYHFILDSGATIHILDKRIVDSAPELFTSLESLINLQTVGGKSAESFNLYSNKEFQIGKIKIENQNCATADFSDFQAENGGHFDGVISISKLAKNNQLIIDFEKGSLFF